MSVTIDSVLVQDKEPTTADLDGGAVLLSVRAGAYFDFNPVASEIWYMLAEPRRVGEIFASLSASHDVDAETLARDVTPFLQTLIEHHLVRLVEPGDVAMKARTMTARLSSRGRGHAHPGAARACVLLRPRASSPGRIVRRGASAVSRPTKPTGFRGRSRASARGRG